MALAPSGVDDAEFGATVRLVTAHRAGNADAFNEIVRTHYDALLKYARKRLANRDDAEDAVQETLLRAFRHLDSFGNEGDWRLGAWLTTILSNVCSNLMMSGRASVRLSDKIAGARAEDGPDVSELVPDPVALAAVNRALAALPSSQRRVFLLRTAGDLPYNEVARREGITADNARQLYHRALTRLRDTLGPGALALMPLFLASGVRSALRRVSSGASRETGQVSASIAGSSGAPSSSLLSSAGSPVNTGVQLIGQFTATPVGQAALAASTASAGRGSVVLGLVASLATAGGLSVPAVTALSTVGAPAAAAAAYSVDLPSPTSVAVASSSAQPAPAASPDQTLAARSPATTLPTWALMGAKAIDSPSAASSSGPTATGTPPPSASGGQTATGPSTTADPSSSPPSSSSSSSATPLPAGTCTGVTGFPGVTTPTSAPPFAPASLVAMLQTGPTALSSGATAPGFSVPSLDFTTGSASVPVSVSVGTCFEQGGSLLAVDVDGTTGKSIQLVGSLVAVLPPTPETPSTMVDLFRGYARTATGAATLPWLLPSSFVAELQVTTGVQSTADLTIAFMDPMASALTAQPQTAASTSAAPTSTGSTAGAGATATSSSTPAPSTTGSTQVTAGPSDAPTSTPDVSASGPDGTADGGPRSTSERSTSSGKVSAPKRLPATSSASQSPGTGEGSSGANR